MTGLRVSPGLCCAASYGKGRWAGGSTSTRLAADAAHHYGLVSSVARPFSVSVRGPASGVDVPLRVYIWTDVATSAQEWPPNEKNRSTRLAEADGLYRWLCYQVNNFGKAYSGAVRPQP